MYRPERSGHEDLNETGKSIEEKLSKYVRSPVFEKLGHDIVGTKRVRDLYYGMFSKSKKYIYNIGNETSILIPKYDSRFFNIGKLKLNQGVDVRYMHILTSENIDFSKKMKKAGFKIRSIDKEYCRTIRRCISENEIMIFSSPPEGREGKKDQCFMSSNREFVDQNKMYFEMIWDEKAKELN